MATLVALTTLLPTTAAAQTDEDTVSTELSPEEALGAAIEQNPALKSAVIDLQRADLALRSELYRYVPTFGLEGQAQFGRRPNVSQQGIVSIESQSYRLTPSIEQTFPAGTTIRGEFNVDRSVQDSVFLGDLGTTWGTDLTFQIIQPWLRGFGRDVGLASRRAARAESRASVARRNDEASRLARDVMTGYWQLWLAQREVAIQQKALEVAGQALEDAQTRLDAGAIAQSDLIPLQTEEARIRETLASARATRTSRQVELARLLGMEREPTGLGTDADPPEARDLPQTQQAIATAREQSYTLQAQKEQIEQARADAALARDQKLARLDTTASVALAGLGRELPPAFESLAVADGIVGMLSVNLQVPIVNKARRADAERAELGVDRAQLQYESAADRVTASVLDQLENLRTARQRLELARETARLAEQNVDYQRTRFDNGAATALDVAQTLQDKREADLRVANLRVELANRRLALDDLTGTLLERLALEEP